MAGLEAADPGAASDAALALAEQLGLSLTVADVLDRRGFAADRRTHRFLEPKLAQLTAPDELAGWRAAVTRLARAARDAERVVVFGDYDCDGITSVAILTEVLRELGAECTPLLAHRFEGGYGLSGPGYQRVRAARPSLLVTCDCGTTDHGRIEQARADGIDVVVVDHHEVPPEPPPATAFVNPQQPGCRFAGKGLATCGLVLLVVAGVRAELGVQLDVRRWLDLVAIGTVADVVPLVGDNRILVRAGLGAVETGARPGLRALLGRLRRGKSLPVTAELVAFQIAPRLNAPGRLGDARVALELLLAADDAAALGPLERVEMAVAERRTIQRSVIADAMAEIARSRYAEDAGLVLARAGWHPGVVGIVAGRLADQYGVPCAVIGLEGDVGRGSVRVPAGFDAHGALEACADLLSSFGGHQAAAGLELPAGHVERFRRRWVEVCAERSSGERSAASWLADARLDERDDLLQVVGDLERLEPCGQANPAPRLLLADTRVRSASPVQDHLKLDLDWSGRRLRGFAPGRAAEAPALAGQRVALVGRLRRDHWLGGQAVEVLVDHWFRVATCSPEATAL